jgi:putative sterol carrier protein
MSAVVTEAMAVMKDKLGDDGFDGVARFVIRDEGSFVIDRSGVHQGEDEAEVTLTANATTFKAILDGDTSPTAAFMTGKLSVDGNMGLAMKLAGVLG